MLDEQDLEVVKRLAFITGAIIFVFGLALGMLIS
jgi:hypothetical protein